MMLLSILTISLFLEKINYMKNFLLILPVVFFQSVVAQTLSFEHDTGGNQKIRKYCATCSPYSKVVKQELITAEKFVPSVDQIKLYPNPTTDKVNLVWSPELGDRIEKIDYVTYNFTQIRPLPFNKREGKVVLDLSDQPIGMYVIIFYLNNGEKLTYKVLKH
ncbi:hypothetical protein SAMN05444360_108175 [Chryseobacterium carnipullorum]|uniref:Uncharacterized protein n=2 Tax=Chryseobacterium carnipullorum TaxID=1124835 RepID=A0A1M7GIN3_CHRCU|nr:hypothetical protein SAMN05444360_108175 [Chryseobacterium carnipullorum]STD05540.1 Uncharacterised protein [Chryseobacterium carnipullorum]